MPFSFLYEVQSSFTAAHPSPPASPHALQQSFGPTLSNILSKFNSQQNAAASSSQNPDALYQAQNELNQVKDIMVHNVEQILSRGERIELLVDKTDTMAGQSLAFRRGAKATRRKMFWKNQKVVMLSVAVGLVCSHRVWNVFKFTK
jgi:vesicle-associated membrane protein 7